MRKVLFIADLHIKLGQKNVPKQWQRNRFIKLAEAINAIDKEYLIIAGDLLDVADPSIEEVGLLYDFLKHIKGEKILIPGNHEMCTKTKDCYQHIEHMMGALDTLVFRDFTTHDGIDYIPYNIIYKNTWPTPKSNLAITHVRGEIPPHVEPEIDLSKFSGYDKVFAGDLHSHKNSQENIYYPGSPFYTSFHREVGTGNGYFIIDLDTGDHEWFAFDLPQLIKKVVSSPDDMVKTDYHHTIYELEGTIEELAKVENTELLSKKVTKNISVDATLNMSGNLSEELFEYLTKVVGTDETYAKSLVSILKEITSDND